MSDSEVLRGLVFSLARVVIEIESPLTIGAGGDDDFVDTPCVSDANGLPVIPGSSLAGVLRHLAAAGQDPDKVDLCTKAFGFQERSRGDSSLIEVSFGQPHGRDNRPVPMLGASVHGDPVLQFLSEGVTRDHVRLDGHGVADGRGKFDVHSVPAGARFTFELVVHEGSPLGVEPLLSLLRGRMTRLGGGSRRGLGAFRVAAASARRFDLRLADDRALFRAVPRALHEPVPDGLLPALSMPEPTAGTDVAIGSIALEPEDLWVIGGGDPADPRLRAGKESIPDIAPLAERRIGWRGSPEQGSVSQDNPNWILPGSSIKGALRHRTAFHARRLRRTWALARTEGPTDMPREVDELFGTIKDRARGDAAGNAAAEGEGRPGRVFLGDAWIAGATPLLLDHVSLDRFSGGPMDGHLFTEAVLHGGGPIEVSIVVDCGLHGVDPSEAAGSRREALQALKHALEDLCEGRLALGTGSNRGHGFFRGKIAWMGAPPWGDSP